LKILEAAKTNSFSRVTGIKARDIMSSFQERTRTNKYAESKTRFREKIARYNEAMIKHEHYLKNLEKNSI
jgi:hypothetical protein